MSMVTDLTKDMWTPGKGQGSGEVKFDGFLKWGLTKGAVFPGALEANPYSVGDAHPLRVVGAALETFLETGNKNKGKLIKSIDIETWMMTHLYRFVDDIVPCLLNVTKRRKN